MDDPVFMELLISDGGLREKDASDNLVCPLANAGPCPVYILHTDAFFKTLRQ